MLKDLRCLYKPVGYTMLANLVNIIPFCLSIEAVRIIFAAFDGSGRPLDTMAVLDANAADGLQQEHPEITTWYIAGHSLGGAMAAGYAAAHEKDYGGLILLAAYSTKNLTDTPLRVLSVYGSEDGVMNRESYEKNRANLPADTTEVVLDGGCHSQFGSYSPQDGDGIPTISGEEQVRQTAEAIAAFVGQ